MMSRRHRIVPGGGGGQRATLDPMQVGVTRAFFVSDSAAERDAALDRRLQNRLRQLKLA